MPRKKRNKDLPPAEVPPAEAEAWQPEPISTAVIRHKDGSVEIIERFAVPARRLRGPLRIIAVDRHQGQPSR